MDTLDYLKSAREELKHAQESADLGTGLMIRPIRENLSALIKRVEKIEDDNDNS